MSETTKPSNCLNCFSEDILDPYRNKCGIIVGLITAIHLKKSMYVLNADIPCSSQLIATKSGY